MGVPHYILKGIFMNIDLGSFWLIKGSGCIATVKSIIAKANGGATVVYTVTDNNGVSSYRMSCEYELFTKMVDKFLTESELKDVLNKEYVKGKTDGYGEGYQHGFTLAKEKITELSDRELESIIDDAFQEGYAQAYSELHAPTTERERQLQEKAWGEGYAEGESDMLETLNELSRQQAEDWNNIETCDEQLEKELALVEKYPHYYKDIRHLNIIDIYRFFDLFEVTDPCIQHSTKKLAVGGKRGAKDYEKDIKEAMDTLKRWEYMQEENKRRLDD